MHKGILTVGLVALGLCVGCGSIKIKVKDSYLLPAGNSVTLKAPDSSPAAVLGVVVDIKDLNLPISVLSSFTNISSSQWLILNANPADIDKVLKKSK